MLDRRSLMLAAGATAALAPLSALAQPATPEAALTALLDDFAHRELLDSPETATSLGLDKGDLAALRGKLDDRSLADIAHDKAETVRRIAALKAIDRSALTGMAAVNYDTVSYLYESRAEGDRLFDYGYGGAGAPYAISQLTGAYQQIPDFLDNQHPIETADDAEAYLSRLDAFAEAMDQETEVARHDAAMGVIPPDFVIDKALTQMAALRGTPGTLSPLVRSLDRRVAGKRIEGPWASRAAALVEDSVTPALDRQVELLTSWRPTATHEAGCWRLKDGEAYYAVSLTGATTTAMKPEEIHALGQDQVRDLSARIDAILKRQGMSQGPVGARIHALFQDKKYRYPNTDAGKETLLADLNKQILAMQARLPQVFATLPKATVQVKRVPKFIEAGAPGGYYNPASLDGSRPGIYWINLRDTAEYPRWTLPTLTYHEAIPGHHLQLSLQQESDLPLLRKMVFLSAYGEGWALYAEQLAQEMGVYASDPIGEVGYLQSALFRACRLVVDTGLHFKRWSREQAIKWMADSYGAQISEVTTEVERYCVIPGQACSYMVGKLTWLRLRDAAKAALGPRFDLRKFHDAGLLAGAMPLTVLEARINAWVALQKA
ncbi:MAG TPA: DUF885 family protein [Caulobacteraceae bacterium]|nr:DUF885 family protein [Caulobacteraceae bacterium]